MGKFQRAVTLILRRESKFSNVKSRVSNHSACWETSKGHTVGRVLIASIHNCDLRVFKHFAINRFVNVNVHVYYRTVRGRLSQLLDSQFGLT